VELDLDVFDDSEEKIRSIDRLLEGYPDMPDSVRKKLLLHREMHEGSTEALIKLSISAGLGTAEDFREVEG